jgi:hypothetical protein
MSEREPDLIATYLEQLSGRLRGPHTDRVLAEAEDHLREGAAAAREAGMTQIEAQEAAISAFGSIAAVVRAHEERPGNLVRGRTPRAIVTDVIMSAWQLGGTGLAAVGLSGVVALVMNVTLGRGFVGQAPAGVTFPAAKCAYWLANWPGAHTCATAAMLENSSDAVTLRVGAGIAGVALLEGLFIVRYLLRRRGYHVPVPLAGYYPALAAAVFGAGAAGLAVLQATGLTVSEGSGCYLSGALVAALFAAWYAVKARRRGFFTRPPLSVLLSLIWSRP